MKPSRTRLISFRNAARSFGGDMLPDACEGCKHPGRVAVPYYESKDFAVMCLTCDKAEEMPRFMAVL